MLVEWLIFVFRISSQKVLITLTARQSIKCSQDSKSFKHRQKARADCTNKNFAQFSSSLLALNILIYSSFLKQ